MGFGSVGFFMKACDELPPPRTPHPAPRALRAPHPWPSGSFGVERLRLDRMPVRRDGTVVDWGAPICAAWNMTEDGAQWALTRSVQPHGKLRRLTAVWCSFIEDGTAARFGARSVRFRADQHTTAEISPYLRFGQLSPVSVLHQVPLLIGCLVD